MFMKRIVTFLIALQLLSVSGVVWAQNVVRTAGEDYNLPKKDGHNGVKEVDGYLNFYDMGGKTGNSPGSYAGAICFTPKNTGEQIEITFETVDFNTDVPAIYVYDGEIDFSGYSSPVPEGAILVLKGQTSNKTAISATGKLSVLYHCKGGSMSGVGTGWTATVKSIIPKDMSFIDCSATQEIVESTYPGKTNQPLIRLNVTADGSLNPLNVTELTFSLDGTTSLSDLNNLRVYYTAGSETLNTSTIFGSAIDPATQTITLTGTQPLSSGNNYFWLIADVSPAAKPLNKLDAAGASAIVAGVQRISSALSPEGNINIDNVVCMPSVPTSFEVGNNPISFYDDGGKEGNISLNFKGQVTFRPTTPGKKVQIRFARLDLFNTSSTGLNDLLKIYNGPAVDENELNSTILKDLITVKSTATDGSLTVTLVSKTGIPKPGFEAFVEEFTPLNMEVNAIDLAPFTTGTVLAGDVSQAILSLNIRTENTEPALTANRFSFNTAGTFATLDKATLYTTGINSDFSTAKPIGEAIITADAFEITCTTPQILQERDNYFWLAYDIRTDAKTGDKIDAACPKVILSDGEHLIENSNPEGERSVKNAYESTIGSFDKTVFGTWTFSHKNKPYGSSYDGIEGNQVVTFRPGSEGKTIELDFSQFSIRYYTYAPADPVFKVYSGTGTTGEPIWSMTSTNKDKGPERPLRSTATDGSMTIVFNANGTAGNTGNGWTAEVREYLSKPMAVNEISAFQSNLNIIKPATVNQEIIGFEITTEGDQNPLSLEEVALSLKGCQDKVKKVSLYYTGKDKTFAATQLLGESTTVAGDMTIVCTTPLVLPERSSFFWIAYDMNETVTPDQKIDAALTSVKINGEAKTPVNGDPEGERLTKNIVELQNDENGTVTVDGSLMFYDDGGSEGKYTKDLKGTITFAPKDPSQVIMLTIRKFSTNVNHEMKIYNGRGVKTTHDVKYYGNLDSKLPEPFMSKADDGSLTIVFDSKSYGTVTDGWEIEVSSYTPRPLVLGTIDVTAQNPAGLLRGMENEVMLKVEIEVTGDKGLFNIGELTFGTTGTSNALAITAANVYFTDTISNFIDDRKFGLTQTDAPYTFNGDLTVTNPGVYKFWLTYNISEQAANGDNISATLSAITTNGTATAIEPNVVAAGSIKAGFNGSYTIGASAGANYPTITAAINALKDGVDGPVVFNLENGTYNELVSIPQITGVSATNTVTIRSESGRYQDVLIRHDRYSEPPYSDDKSAQEYGVFTFAGADYFTLEGVTLTTTDVSFPSVVHIKNMSRHVTVKDCYLYAPMTTTSSTDINLVYMYAVSKANCNSDYFTLENCLLEGGYIGASIGGTTNVSLPYQKGAVMRNNVFRNQYSKSIYLKGEIDAQITGNSLFNDQTVNSSFNAMDIYRGYENLLISGNTVSLNLQKAAVGLYFRPAAGTAEKRARIYNNEISFATVSGTAYGIQIASDCKYADFSHNTIRIKGSNATSAPIFVSAQPADVTIENNLLQNEAGGYVYRVNNVNYLTGLSFSHNALYTSSTTGFAYAGANLADFDAWKTTTGETGSVVEQVAFLSDLVLEPKNQGQLNSGKPLSFATTDLYGNARSETSPTIGAYEYNNSPEAPAMLAGYPAVSGIKHEEVSVSVKASLSGKVFMLAKADSETAPAVEDILASAHTQEIRKGAVSSLTIDNLNSQTTYHLYAVLQSLRGVHSDIVVSDAFTTTFIPTEVSTFENMTAGQDGTFTDGTASFFNFTVTDITDGIGSNNRKAAKVGSTATVTVTNAANGLVLNGFYLKSDVAVSMKTYLGEIPAGTKELPATNNKWVFCNLKDMGLITAVELTGGENSFIDNFSGQPQPISLELDEVSTTEGTPVTLATTISGGVYPYAYVWKNAVQEPLSTEAAYTFTPAHIGEYSLTVTDAWGTSLTGKTIVRVSGNAHTATFDDLYLPAESYWNGDMENDEMYNTFYSGSYGFSNVLMKEYNSWALFGYSNRTSTSFTSMDDQYNSAAGSGANGSANYSIVYADTYMGTSTLTISNRAEGDSIRGTYITNSAWAKDAVINGDGLSSVEGGFATGDYFRLTATGKSGNTTTGTCDFYLADYRSTDTRSHYCLDSWQWFDLRPLGKVTEVTFALTSTKRNSFGMTTPAYFCMDDFNGNRQTTTTEQQIGNTTQTTSIELDPFFSFDPIVAPVVYHIEDGYNQTVTDAVIDGDKLQLTGKALGELNIVISATQKGRKEFVTMPVLIDKGVGLDNTNAAQVAIYPVPVTDMLHIATDMTGYTIEVISLNGTRIMKQDHNTGSASIQVADLESGVYLLKISNGERTIVKRFSKVN